MSDTEEQYAAARKVLDEELNCYVTKEVGFIPVYGADSELALNLLWVHNIRKRDVCYKGAKITLLVLSDPTKRFAYAYATMANLYAEGAAHDQMEYYAERCKMMQTIIAFDRLQTSLLMFAEECMRPKDLYMVPQTAYLRKYGITEDTPGVVICTKGPDQIASVIETVAARTGLTGTLDGTESSFKAFERIKERYEATLEAIESSPVLQQEVRRVFACDFDMWENEQWIHNRTEVVDKED